MSDRATSIINTTTRQDMYLLLLTDHTKHHYAIVQNHLQGLIILIIIQRHATYTNSLAIGSLINTMTGHVFASSHGTTTQDITLLYNILTNISNHKRTMHYTIM